MKKLFSKNTIKNTLKKNMITILIIGFLALTQAPTIANNFKTQGSKVSSLKVKTINGDGTEAVVDFPPKGRSIAIFWSTTCAPCKLEMARLKSSVEDGEIPKERLFALNSFESQKKIRKFLAKDPHPFTFIKDPGLGMALGVRATPTTVFIEDGEVVSMKSGMSFLGIWSAENFLD